MTHDPIQLITARRAAIEAQRAALKEQLAQLDADEKRLVAEERDLEVAARVFDRLASEDQRSQEAVTSQPTHRVRIRIRPRNVGSPRPEGIPSVPEMATTLLAEAEGRGRAGMTGREIVDEIDARWWPGVSENLILPTLYRSMKKGQWVTKKGSLFKRLKPDSATQETANGLGHDTGNVVAH